MRVTGVWSDVRELKLRGRRFRTRPLEDLERPGEPLRIRWEKVELAREKFYDNVNPQWHWDEIEYTHTQLSGYDDRATIDGNVQPVATPTQARTHALGFGAMRYRVTLERGDKRISSAGSESVYKGGLTDEVHRIVYAGNTGHPFIDAAYAFFNIPYIWGSALTSPPDHASHQTELFVGADCADYVVAARRMQGDRTVRYGGSLNLRPEDAWRLTTYVAKEPEKKEVAPYGEIYVEPNSNKPVRWGGSTGVRVGDLILYHRHVGILSADEAPLGVLDPNDKLLHIYFATPRETRIKHGYPGDFSIVRWRKRLANDPR